MEKGGTKNTRGYLKRSHMYLSLHFQKKLVGKENFMLAPITWKTFPCFSMKTKSGKDNPLTLVCHLKHKHRLLGDDMSQPPFPSVFSRGGKASSCNAIM